MPGMRAGRLVSSSGRAVSLVSRSSSLTPLRNWVQNRPGPAVIEPSDRISRLPYQKIARAHSRPVLPRDAEGQELLPPVAYAPVLADIGTGTLAGSLRARSGTVAASMAWPRAAAAVLAIRRIRPSPVSRTMLPKPSVDKPRIGDPQVGACNLQCQSQFPNGWLT